MAAAAHEGVGAAAHRAERAAKFARLLCASRRRRSSGSGRRCGCIIAFLALSHGVSSRDFAADAPVRLAFPLLKPEQIELDLRVVGGATKLSRRQHQDYFISSIRD